MLQIKIFPVNPLGANCYVCWEDAGHACIVVDPGFYRSDEEDMVFTFLTENGLWPDAVFLTHAHFDHAWSAASVARRCNCPVWMSAADDPILRDHSAMLDRLKLEKTVELFEYKDATDGTVIHAGGVDWRVIATPGHTPGCVCYLCEAWGVLLSGDTLFAGSCGTSSWSSRATRTSFPAMGTRHPSPAKPLPIPSCFLSTNPIPTGRTRTALPSTESRPFGGFLSCFCR